MEARTATSLGLGWIQPSMQQPEHSHAEQVHGRGCGCGKHTHFWISFFRSWAQSASGITMRSSMSWHSAMVAGTKLKFLTHMLLTDFTAGMTRKRTLKPDRKPSRACDNCSGQQNGGGVGQTMLEEK